MSPRARGHHHPCRQHAGHVVRAGADVRRLVVRLDRRLPEHHAEHLGEGLRVEHVVHEDVEPTLLGADAVEHRLDLRVVAVIAGDGDAVAAQRGHRVGGGADGAGDRGGRVVDGAPGDIHGRTGLAEPERHALADAAAGSGDECDGVGEGEGHRAVE